MTFETNNPETSGFLYIYSPHEEAKVDDARSDAVTTFESWQDQSVEAHQAQAAELATDVGPQAREDLFETLHEQVWASVDRNGFYYPPTVLTDVLVSCISPTEELFGSVATVVEVEDEVEAVELGNKMNYDLGASVWTENRERGRQVAERIDAGAAFVNEMSGSDPRLPLGGVRDSGYGVELSYHGLTEFTNGKSYWIQ